MMMKNRIRTFSRLAFLALFALAPALLGAQQGGGTVSGTVREAGSGRPVPNARVSVVGTGIVGTTPDDGTYALRAVPAGSKTIRVPALGHSASVQTVNVGAGATTTADFSLATVAVQLEQVVTT